MKVKNLAKLVIIIGILSILISCSEKENDRILEFTFPLAVGDNWEYNKSFTIDYDSLAEFNGFNDTTFYSSINIDVISNEIIFDSINVYNFKTSTIENGNTWIDNEYLNNYNDSLLSYGYSKTSKKIIGRNFLGKNSIIFRNKKFTSLKEVVNYTKTNISVSQPIKEDSILYHPSKVYVYPFEEGKEWLYRSVDEFTIHKRVISSESFLTEAGKFNCWKIKYQYNDSFDDIDFYDYISKDGLIKQYLEIKNMNIVDPSGINIGTCNYIEKQELTDFDVQ